MFKKSRINVIMMIICCLVIGNAAMVSAADYMGSSSCQNCHSGQWDTWETSNHTKKVCDMEEANIVCDGDENGTNDFMDGLVLDGTTGFDAKWAQFTMAGGATGDYSPILDENAGVYTITMGDQSFVIEKMLGCSKIWKQRFMTRLGNSFYISPLQYNIATHEWVTYHPEHWYTFVDTDGDGAVDSGEQITGFIYAAGDTPVTMGKQKNSFQRRCMGCHTTGLTTVEMSVDGEWLGEPDAQFKEFNVGCESCHGPGSEHIAGGGDASKIVNPADLNFERKMEVCGQCHNRGTSSAGTHSYPWYEADNVGYRPGDILAQFYREKAGYWPDGASKKHHQQYIDLKNSPHWGAQVGCMACHDSHDSTGIKHMLRYENDDNTLCNTCHTDLTGTVLTNHTHHPPVGGAEGVSRCSKCHMPKIAKSAVEYDIHAHTFRVFSPEKTLDHAMPNSCAFCHRDNQHGEGAVDGSMSDWSEDSDVTIANWAMEHWNQWWNPDGPVLKIGTDQHVYGPGDEMIVFLEGENNGPSEFATIYIALEMFGSFYFFPSWDSVPGAIMFTVVEGLDLDPFPFLAFPMSGMPDGNFNWYLAAIGTGGNLLGDLSIAPWSYSSSGAASPDLAPVDQVLGQITCPVD